MVKLAEVAAERGDRWLCLGQDLPWCEAGYDGPLAEKLWLADTVIARGVGRSFHAVRPRAGEGLGVLTWDEVQGHLGWVDYGEPLPRRDDLLAALAPERREGRAA